VLADFIVDWKGSSTPSYRNAESVSTIHYNGAWCHVGADVAAIITAPSEAKYKYTARLSFTLESYKCTNNIEEYKVVILGLQKLRALGVNNCIVKIVSMIVAGQIEKDYTSREPVLMQHLSFVQSLET
jgi:ribonuclease HI